MGCRARRSYNAYHKVSVQSTTPTLVALKRDFEGFIPEEAPIADDVTTGAVDDEVTVGVTTGASPDNILVSTA